MLVAMNGNKTRPGYKVIESEPIQDPYNTKYEAKSRIKFGKVDKMFATPHVISNI